MKDFAQRLKEVRQERNMTQKQVAEYIKTAEQNYQHYEYGKHKPNMKILAKLCACLEVSSDYLIGLTGNKAAK